VFGSRSGSEAGSSLLFPTIAALAIFIGSVILFTGISLWLHTRTVFSILQINRHALIGLPSFGRCFAMLASDYLP
jgi:hypothetical protein